MHTHSLCVLNYRWHSHLPHVIRTIFLFDRHRLHKSTQVILLHCTKICINVFHVRNCRPFQIGFSPRPFRKEFQQIGKHLESLLWIIVIFFTLFIIIVLFLSEGTVVYIQHMSLHLNVCEWKYAMRFSARNAKCKYWLINWLTQNTLWIILNATSIWYCMTT